MRLIALVGVSVSLLLSEPPPTRAQAGSLDVERFRKLRQKLYDRDSEIRWGAAKAFTELGSEIHLTVNSLRARVATDVDPMLAKSAIPELIAALKDESVLVRRRAADTLGVFGPEARTAVPALIEVLKDPDPGTKQESSVSEIATASLGQIGPDAKVAASAMMGILNTKDSSLRTDALVTLAKIVPKDKKLVPLFVQILKDKDQQGLRYAAAMALGYLGRDAREAVPDLIEALKAVDIKDLKRRSLIFGGVLWALEQVGPDAKAAVPAIRALANDPDEHVRAASRQALKKLDPVP